MSIAFEIALDADNMTLPFLVRIINSGCKYTVLCHCEHAKDAQVICEALNAKLAWDVESGETFEAVAPGINPC